MLQEEFESFAYDDDDLSFIPSVNIHITLNDITPVQKTYISIHKPLHVEVK